MVSEFKASDLVEGYVSENFSYSSKGKRTLIELNYYRGEGTDTEKLCLVLTCFTTLAGKVQKSTTANLHICWLNNFDTDRNRFKASHPEDVNYIEGTENIQALLKMFLSEIKRLPNVGTYSKGSCQYTNYKNNL